MISIIKSWDVKFVMYAKGMKLNNIMNMNIHKQ